MLFELLFREADLADDCRQRITLGGERSQRGGRSDEVRVARHLGHDFIHQLHLGQRDEPLQIEFRFGHGFHS